MSPHAAASRLADACSVTASSANNHEERPKMSTRNTLQRIGLATIATIALAGSGASAASADVRASTAEPQTTALVSAVDQDTSAAKLPAPTTPISAPPPPRK
jgi:hypothetical protein